MNTGVNSASIKETNRALILKLICTNKDVSRIWLANKTGLTRMTLSNIISSLTKKGYLCDVHDLETGNPVGRHPIKVDLAETSPLVCGISIKRDRISGILMDLKAHELKRYSVTLSGSDNKDSFTDKVITVARELIKETQRKILGIGVASVGPVDSEAGRILDPINFHGIKNVDIREILEEATGLKVYLSNLMSAGALTEKYYGKCVDVSDFVYVGITNGVGAGIISGGKLFRSPTGFGGEFGHMSINYDGPKCSCGNRGCLEMYASIPKIIETVNDKCGTNYDTIEEVNEFCLVNDTARYTVYRILDKLAIAITGIVNIVDPAVVIIGDEGSAIDESLFYRVENEVARRMLVKSAKHIPVLKSDFGSDICLIGSATIVADMVFSAEIPVED